MVEHLDSGRSQTFFDVFLDGKPLPLSPERRRELPINVVCGGDSSERPGSIKSGFTVAALLHQAGYARVQTVDVRRDSLHLLAARESAGVAFVTLHGGYGEDGTLQGMLEMLDIPYTGSGVAASAVSADKALFSRFVRGLGYNAPRQDVVGSVEVLEAIDMIFPKVIKPASSGCSYGIFFSTNKDELMRQARITAEFGSRIIVEDYIPGREVTVGLLEDPNGGQPVILPLCENRLVRPILDFEAKIQGGEHLYEVELPAQLDPLTRDSIATAASHIFRELGCRGYVRMDIRLRDDGTFFFIENNTNPGLLSVDESDFPKMLVAGGIDPAKFVDMMIEASLRNYQSKHDPRRMNMPSKREMLGFLGRTQ